MSSIDPDHPKTGGIDEDFDDWESLIHQAVTEGDLEEFLEAVEEIQSMEPQERFIRSATTIYSAFAENGEADINQVFERGDASPISSRGSVSPSPG